MFQDITTLLLDPKAFKDTIDLFVERYKDKNINVIAGRLRLRSISLFSSSVFSYPCVVAVYVVSFPKIRSSNCKLKLGK